MTTANLDNGSEQAVMFRKAFANASLHTQPPRLQYSGIRLAMNVTFVTLECRQCDSQCRGLGCLRIPHCWPKAGHLREHSDDPDRSEPNYNDT
jgi:hypothetical protein